MKKSVQQVSLNAANPISSIILTSLALALITFPARHTRASVIVNAREVGADVVFTGGGTLNLTSLGLITSSLVPPANITPAAAAVFVGPSFATYADFYPLLSHPLRFGSGGINFASIGGGDTFGLDAVNAYLVVPRGYVSESPLTATDTYRDASFASLGLTPGTYIFTLPHDTFTLQIGRASVPDTGSTVTMIGAALLLLFGWQYFQRKNALG